MLPRATSSSARGHHAMMLLGVVEAARHVVRVVSHRHRELDVGEQLALTHTLKRDQALQRALIPDEGGVVLHAFATPMIRASV